LFWEEKWVNNSPLSIQFPRLYHLIFQKYVNVSKVKLESWGIIRFRRKLYGEILQKWNALKDMVDENEIQLTEETGIVK
jgi:hypothetical protein